MQVDHDSAVALHDVVWLVNTDDRRVGCELLPDPTALLTYLDEQHFTGSRTGTTAELRSIHELRGRLREIFDLAAGERPDEVVHAINALIAEAGPTPLLVQHDDLPLHLHFTTSDAPLARRLAAEMSIALAVVIRDGGAERLRVCPAPGCGRVLVDLTKNQSRRYCDAQCANRVHVAAYRQRKP